eukprot:TRINITY_DN10496_c0_g1_i1.p1 TRINITY_DN10496_c0_g1~~TRINITY_DN10496_c0_g1_i1.p1  ORF type:complete len:262 (-),score=55.14 TRINITY_DN10496_c0_g1_i1:10-795(-)
MAEKTTDTKAQPEALVRLRNYLFHFVAKNPEKFKKEWPVVSSKLSSHPELLQKIKRLVDGEETPEPMPAKEAERERLNIDYLKMYNEKKDTDFVLKIEDKSLPCHKSMLSVRCDYFGGLFRSGMTETQLGEMKIPGPDEQGLTASALDTLLRYLYCDKPEWCLKDPFDCLYILGSAGYFSLSSEFGNRHNKLLDACKKYVEEHLTLDNCVKLFNLSVDLDLEEIEKRITQFLLSNGQELLDREDAKLLPQEIREQLSAPKQ